MAALEHISSGATLLKFPRAAQSLRSLLLTALKQHRLPELLMEGLIRDAASFPDGTAQDALAAALGKRMQVRGIDFQKARGILLLGPCGSGKSAVAAKIAHHALLSGRRVELAGAADGLALFRTATFHSDGLMVMEAAGFNPLNRRALSAFAALGDARDAETGGVESIGVISAVSDAQDVLDIVSALRLNRVIVTGLDRTARLGAVVAAVTSGAALAHVSHGARTDDPLESLSPESLAELLLD